MILLAFEHLSVILLFAGVHVRVYLHVHVHVVSLATFHTYRPTPVPITGLITLKMDFVSVRLDYLYKLPKVEQTCIPQTADIGAQKKHNINF